jgi:U6 snRNA-associated Sm-like protein LSm3
MESCAWTRENLVKDGKFRDCSRTASHVQF